MNSIPSFQGLVAVNPLLICFVMLVLRNYFNGSYCLSLHLIEWYYNEVIEKAIYKCQWLLKEGKSRLKTRSFSC